MDRPVSLSDCLGSLWGVAGHNLQRQQEQSALVQALQRRHIMAGYSRDEPSERAVLSSNVGQGRCGCDGLTTWTRPLQNLGNQLTWTT